MGAVPCEITTLASSSDWPSLRLRREPAAGAFPLEVLPAVLAALTEEVVQAAGGDPALVAAPALAVAAGAIGRSVELRIAPEWVAGASLFLACVVPKGEDASSAFAHALAPARRIQAELGEAAQRARRRGREERERLQRHTSLSCKDIQKRVPMPRARRLLVEELDLEAVLPRLARDRRGLLGVCEELAPLVGATRQRERNLLRRVWVGRTVFLRCGRDSHKEPRPVQRPHLSLVGCLTPERVGRGADPDRWLFACPERAGWPALGGRRAVSAAAVAGWAKLVRRLWDQPPAIVDGWAAPHRIDLSLEGADAFQRRADGFRAEVEDDGFPEDLRGPYAALAVYAGRLTLVLHLMRLAAEGVEPSAGPPPAVGPEAVEGAWRLVAYFAGQARRVQGRLAATGGDAMPDGAGLILKWIHRHPEADRVREANLTQWYPPTRGWPRAVFADGFAWLARQGAVRPAVEAPAAETGRKRSPVWEIHPELREGW
jgi:hypothetical protein